MTEQDSRLSRGEIALVALCHEYCTFIGSDEAEGELSEVVRRLLGLLPRIYITAFDIPFMPEDAEDIAQSLDEEQYTVVASRLARIFGEHDTYLDTFHEDMKYSETPLAASVSEGLADLYQDFYDFTSTVRDLPADSISGVVTEMCARFREYWSETLCNALRVLNFIYAKGNINE